MNQFLEHRTCSPKYELKSTAVPHSVCFIGRKKEGMIKDLSFLFLKF